MAENTIVPFGKYKGQPVEAMATDRQYVDWLFAQDWFRDRYQGMFTLIVNNFAEPGETREHNRLQMRFLDDELCARLALSVGLAWLTKIAKGVVERWPAEKGDMERELAEAHATLDRYQNIQPIIADGRRKARPIRSKLLSRALKKARRRLRRPQGSSRTRPSKLRSVSGTLNITAGMSPFGLSGKHPS